MAAARLLAYLVAIVASAALVGRLLTVRSALARLMAGMAGAWVLNSLILASYLVWTMITGDLVSPWREWTLSINAVLLAAAPVLLVVYLQRLDGKAK